MPLPTVYDQSRRGIIWTDEEVYAFIDHCQAHEDELYKVGLAVSFGRKKRVSNRELLQIQEVLTKA